MGDVKDTFQSEFDAYIQAQLSVEEQQQVNDLITICRTIMKRAANAPMDDDDKTVDDFWQKSTDHLLDTMSRGDPVRFQETAPGVRTLLKQLEAQEKKHRAKHALAFKRILRPPTAVNMGRVTEILGSSSVQCVRTSHSVQDILCITRLDGTRIGFHTRPIPQHVFRHYVLCYDSVRIPLMSIMYQLDPHNALDSPLYNGAREVDPMFFPKDAIVRHESRPNLNVHSSEHSQSSNDWYQQTRKNWKVKSHQTYCPAKERMINRIQSARLGFLTHPIEFRLVLVTGSKHAQWAIVATTMTGGEWNRIRIGSDYGLFTVAIV